MTRTSFGDIISNSKVMLSGLQAHAEAVARRGLDAEFITGFETVINSCESLNNEQEALKAGLKSKTANLNQQLAYLKARHSEAAKLVKLSVDKSGWLEFGITARR
ncbi:MAG: hypothetical protein ABIA75_14085 [Candidatus Neomarinimicrobiota bacterium]